MRFKGYGDFEACVVGKGETNNGYDNSGWIAVVRGDDAAIYEFSHCSCYGTRSCIGIPYNWDSKAEAEWTDTKPDWSGSVADLIVMAQSRADPSFPERAASPQDYDYAQLEDMYRQVLEWSEARA